uniref:Uncharacterized protein n=1 Tax=Nymphaea colorata TaxID=210225 RepID=A0A5K0X0C6_9MAGN
MMFTPESCWKKGIAIDITSCGRYRRDSMLRNGFSAAWNFFPSSAKAWISASMSTSGPRTRCKAVRAS